MSLDELKKKLDNHAKIAKKIISEWPQWKRDLVNKRFGL